MKPKRSKSNITDLSQDHIAFFGGCGEFGMNLTSYSIEGQIYIVDCGVMFAPDHLIGVDGIIPDIDPYLEQYGGPKAYIITHGHEDHIGGLPYYLKKWPAPIYATAWTIELLKSRLSYHDIAESQLDITVVAPGDLVAKDNVSFQFFHVNHSIPMTCSLGITHRDKRIFHTGDFKFDQTPPYEPPTDLSGIEVWAKPGVDLLIADSTNAPTPGWSGSEKTAQSGLLNAMKDIKGRVFVSTFSSNLWRLLGVLEVASQIDRKVAFVGGGMHKCMEIASKLNMIPDHLKDVIVSRQELPYLPHSNTAIMISGCQAEHKSALNRMVSSGYQGLKVEAGDTFVLSSRVIPGNEKTVAHLISAIHKQEGIVITQKSHSDIHVSGHAHSEELDHLMGLLKPKNFIAVHGTHTQLRANSAISDKQTIAHVEVENGVIVGWKSDDESPSILQRLTPARWYIDSWSNNFFDFDTMRSRHKIGDSGLLICTGIFDLKKKVWIEDFQIATYGIAFPHLFNQTKWSEQLKRMTSEALEQNQRKGTAFDDEWRHSLANQIKKAVSQFLVKSPVVITNLYPLSR